RKIISQPRAKRLFERRPAWTSFMFSLLCLSHDPSSNECIEIGAHFQCPGIPTGFCTKAQGSAERATLGHRPRNISNRNAVVANSFLSGLRDVAPIALRSYVWRVFS